MSKHKLIREIRREIRLLNWAIDSKIIKGLSYREESRRHKFLLMQLNHLKRSTRQSILDRMSQFASVFML